MPESAAPYEIVPLTADRWPDLERLFGERGAVGGCWCMYWRLKHRTYEQLKGAGNRAAMQDLAASGEIPGLLAYAGVEPVGWCSFGPRQEFPRLASSRILAPVDEQPVWSVVCFFIHRRHRRGGISLMLLQAAADYARAQGAAVLEGYPVEPHSGSMPTVFAFTGIASTFRKAGFIEVVRRSETRPVMRLDLTVQDQHER